MRNVMKILGIGVLGVVLLVVRLGLARVIRDPLLQLRGAVDSGELA